MATALKIVGVSAFYHDASCCLLVGGELVAAASEERFTRVKHDPRLPVEAFLYCLQEGGLDIVDLDAIAYYERPALKQERQLWSRSRNRNAPLRGETEPPEIPDPGQPERLIRERLGFDGPVLTYPHHLSHAASAFDFSPFADAAVLTVDGVGEWATTTYGRAGAAGIELFEEVRFPHSLGLLYSTLTAYLGFAVNDGEYKVMGLAPYGEPRYTAEMERLLRSEAGGQFRLDLAYFDFVAGERMFSPRLIELFGEPPRKRGEPLTAFHHDVARSLQLTLEEILLEKVRYLAAETGLPHLVMAGGVALNGVANGRLLREGPFKEMFIQPAAGDAGGCLGAAALAHRELAGVPRRETLRRETPRHEAEGMDGARTRATASDGVMRHTSYGPAFRSSEIERPLAATGLPVRDFAGRDSALLDEVAAELLAGRVVGWFQGRMEMGPRALGQRSILASPLLEGMRDRVNRSVKKREGFRPFAPAVLAAEADRYFQLGSPRSSAEGAALPRPHHFMLEVCPVSSLLPLPAVTHVDGSARPQVVEPEVHPRFAALLAAFARLSGCPVLLNTSFNLAGEPIVCTPEDALFTFGLSEIDLLVLESFVLDRRDLPAELPELLALWERLPPSPFGGRRQGQGESAISETLYTFV